ncbi:hypothetical protein LZC95_34540 [Pendulispora brunnea]|uniref:MYXO-CTERM domain-containing protein n=1 Tax=Pendulispora brunnea TaxID=2905690 RepID=A0ABZ2K353_9BACT
MQRRLTPMMKLALFAFTPVALISHERESHACTPPPWWPMIALSRTIPKDAVIPIRLSQQSGVTFEYEVSDEGRSPVAVVLENSSDESTKFLRPAAGEFPLGALHIALRSKRSLGPWEQSDTYDVIVAAERMADWKLRLTNPKLNSIRIPDDSSPKVLCHHPPVRACGGTNTEPSETTEIPSRVKKAVTLSFNTETTPWAPYLMLQSIKYTVRLADGSIVEEPPRTHGRYFESTGVEYCAEVTFTPRFGTAPAQTERICAPHGDMRYDVTQADHDEMLVASAQAYQCTSLDFPEGVPIPGPVADKSTGGKSTGAQSSGGATDGCSSTPRRGDGSDAIPLLLLGTACVLRRKRRQRG